MSLLKSFIPNRFYNRYEYIFFAIHAFKILAGKKSFSANMRFAIAPMMEFAKICYNKGSDFSFLKLDNVSGGISNVLISMAIKHEPKASKNWLLVSEPYGTGAILKNHLSSKYMVERDCDEIDSVLGRDWNSGEFDFDLCRPNATLEISRKFDLIIAQALLEHVFDPVELLRNLIPLLNPNVTPNEAGILVIHTNNPLMPLHRWPVDTLRYHDDWFILVQQYLPLTLLELNTQGHNVFAVYQLNA
jgi:SAM-dependent methyltransferase